jgi:hypothetical protein
MESEPNNSFAYEIIKQTPHSCVYKFSPASCNVDKLNLIRRTLMSKSESMRIDFAIICSENNYAGQAYREFELNKNVGFIEIDASASYFKSVNSQYNREHIMKDPYSTLCFELDVAYDSMNAKKEKYIYASDLKWIPLSDTQPHPCILNPEKKIMHQPLFPFQRIKRRLYAIKNSGETHVKWRSVECVFDPATFVCKVNLLTKAKNVNEENHAHAFFERTLHFIETHPSLT